MDGTCRKDGREDKCLHSFGSETLGKRLLSRSKRIWEYNDKMDVNGIRWEVVNLIYLAEQRDSRRCCAPRR
jgi:hypothetical protein